VVEEVSPAPSPSIRIARELCALALLAFAAFGTVSLVSIDIGRSLNLGGPVGAAIAAMLGGLVGYQSYTAMILVAWLAQRVWTGARAVTVAREIGGGVLLILALATASALWDLHDVRMGGEVGASIATLLNDSINVAGGLIVVALGFICGLALMLKRAPTELLAEIAGKIRPRRDEFELEDVARVPFSLSEGDEV
jgi:4TM region of DNA translocase FtsK/SpoIIIE